MKHTVAAGAAALVILALPAVADAHVTVHPNVIPEGAFAKLSFRVPNETDNATTTRLAVKMPPGFVDVSASPPPGWRFSMKTRKLAKPVKTDDGTADREVSEIEFSGGRIPPGQFLEFPISVAVPGHAGSILTFKALQTYSNGQVVRWIGPPDADHPAPTINISAKDGPIQDVAGGEAGPPAAGEVGTTPVTRIVQKNGASKPLAIAALVLGGVGLVLAVAAFATRRRRSATS